MGEISGIVDVDGVCYGDPLCVLGLTQMAILSIGGPTDYIDYWFEFQALNQKWDESQRVFQRKILTLYTLWHCVGFMSECGRSFNRDTPLYVDQQTISQYKEIYEHLLSLVQG